VSDPEERRINRIGAHTINSAVAAHFAPARIGQDLRVADQPFYSGYTEAAATAVKTGNKGEASSGCF
jgi:hypothetical protein